MAHWALLAALSLLALSAAWAVSYLRRFGPIAAAYKAKIICSGFFLGGRDPASLADEDASAGGKLALRVFRAEGDEGGRAVTASFMGCFARTAIYRPGLGATLVPGRGFGLKEASLPEPSPGSRPLEEAGGGEALKRAVDRAFDEPDPRRPRRTRAVVVLLDGRVAAEGYAPGFGQDTPMAGWSMAKSVLSALVGTLVGQGRLAPERTLPLPEWSGSGDPRGRITLDDLLRMRSGLEFDEGYSNPLGDVERMLFACPDSAGFASCKPLAAEPGTSWCYSSGTTNIISRGLRFVLGGSREDYLSFPRKALFNRIGMSSAVLETDAAGNFVASSFMYASARDWARFGLLYARDGVWDGERILPEGWVAYSTNPTPQSDGRFGAHWWLKLHKELGGHTEAASRLPSDAFHALGHEGQALTVIPSRKLVVARLGLCSRSDSWNHAEFLESVLKALEGR